MSETQVVALGFFDGIHLGHAALLDTAAALAAECAAVPAVLSFDTHPDALVRGVPVPLINTAAERRLLIREQSGIGNVSLLPFTEATMRMPWQHFLDTLVREQRVSGIVVGHDFRFGWRGEGTPPLLSAYCGMHGISCSVIPPVTLDGLTVSSTHIRSLLAAGDIAGANRFLGHAHLITGRAAAGVIPHDSGLQSLPDGEYLAGLRTDAAFFPGQRITVRHADILLPQAFSGAVELRLTDRLL